MKTYFLSFIPRNAKIGSKMTQTLKIYFLSISH